MSALSPPVRRPWNPLPRLFPKTRSLHLQAGGIFACFCFGLWALGLAWQQATVLHIDLVYQPPCWAHPCGCDGIGRDLLARLLQGATLSLCIGFCAAGLDLLLGTAVACLCLGSARLDRCVLTLLDIGYSLPYLVLAALLSSWCGSSSGGTLLALVVVGWVPAARLLRGHLLSLAQHESILTARQLGIRFPRLFLTYLWPHSRPALRAHLAAAVPQAILAESLLSYLGMGIQPPLASLGSLCSEGLLMAWDAPWMALFPIATLVVIQWVTLSWADRMETQLSNPASSPSAWNEREWEASIVVPPSRPLSMPLWAAPTEMPTSS